MKILRRFLAVLMAAVIISAAAFFASKDTDTAGGAVTVWCVGDNSMSEQLNASVEEYNSLPERTALPVELHVFESEEKLAEAFEISSPDILLCTHTRAFSLYEREKLTDISAEMKYIPQYSQNLLGRSTCIGRSFFTIGIDVPVLVINKALCDRTSFDSIEALLTEASAYTAITGQPFFGCDSYSELFDLLMLRNGKEFGADFENESGKQYVDLYNLLARAAFDGSMYTKTGNMAQYVRAGALPCAAVDSSSLAGMSLDGLSVSDVPAMYDYVNRDTIGTATGLAVTNGGSRSKADIGAFVSWLFENGRCISSAKSCGLAGAETAEGIPTGVLDHVLYEITESGVVSLNDPGSAYEANREDFDKSFADAMAFIAN